MLSSGRLGTLAEWLQASRQLQLDAPVLSMAEAELALRQGKLARAEAHGLQVGCADEAPGRIRSRAFSVAGRAAYLSNRHSDALAHYGHALDLAPDREA